MHIHILTLFPEMFPGTLGHSIAGKALEKGLWSFEVTDIRQFATDKHKTVDEKSYGGGTGLVMKPDVIGAAIDFALAKTPNAQLIYPTPRGIPFTQAMAHELVSRNHENFPTTNYSQPAGETIQYSPTACDVSNSTPTACGGGKGGADATSPNLSQNTPNQPIRPLIILCGRYEGVDQRILDQYQPLEISLGDYVLSGGEIAAQVILDACIRLIPGAISSEEAIINESFSLIPASNNKSNEHDYPNNNSRLLEYPQYTKPPIWRGLEVPEVLLGGDHQKIKKWRLEQALEITRQRRPDLLK